MSESLAPDMACTYSVCPANLKTSLWILCLLIGAVTKASILPATKSSVALCKDKKAYFPPVSFAVPNSIFTSSSQQLIILGLPAWALSALFMT